MFLKRCNDLWGKKKKEESTCQSRGHEFNPWSGKIPHAVEQLSPCATTSEPMRPRVRAVQQEKPPQ